MNNDKYAELKSLVETRDFLEKRCTELEEVLKSGTMNISVKMLTRETYQKNLELLVIYRKKVIKEESYIS